MQKAVEDAAARSELALKAKGPKEFTPVLDDIFGGHHGGYERGVGTGYTRGRSGNSAEVDRLRSQLERTEEDRDKQREKVESLTTRMQSLEQVVQQLVAERTGSTTSTPGLKYLKKLNFNLVYCLGLFFLSQNNK